MTTIPINTFEVLGCGALAIVAGQQLHARSALLRRCLIPPQIVAGALLAVPTLGLRQFGWILDVDPTVQQVAMVALFTSIGFSLDRDALRRGGIPVAILLGMFALGGLVQNAVGVVLARALGLHPLIGIAVGAISLAGGPATSLAFGPTLEAAGASGATTTALAAAIAGIVVAGITAGTFGVVLIRRDGLVPSGALPFGSEPALEPGAAMEAGLPEVLVLFGFAMGLGFVANSWMNRGLSVYSVALPATVGAMLVAAGMRAVLQGFTSFQMPGQRIEEIGSVALSWFIPLALWTLHYWELPRLAGPAAIILAAQFPVTIALGYATYRMVGRSFDSALMASGYFGYMYGTMANSLAAFRELEERFGVSPRAFLVISISGGVLSDLANVVVIAVSRAAVAAWLH